MRIYCCACNMDVDARLTSGEEVYKHRVDLHTLPFWICDACGNYVGCHHKTSNPTQPLGCIPSIAIKDIRNEIHKILDPIWKSGHVSRARVYSKISKELGYAYHTGELRSEAEAMNVLRIVNELSKEYS